MTAAPSFSGPTLEQDGESPSYGLLLALANVAVRGAARDGSARSPSPGRAAPSPVRGGRPASAPPVADSQARRQLGLLLERTLTLLLEQVSLGLLGGGVVTSLRVASASESVRARNAQSLALGLPQRRLSHWRRGWTRHDWGWSFDLG